MRSRPARAVQRRRSLPRVLSALMLIAGLILSGCSPKPATGSAVPAPPQRPRPVDRSTPQAALRSYLEWTTFAYRMIDSDLASSTASPDEGVRVDSYVELLKERGRSIDQHLASFDIVRQSIEGTHALIATRESWEYRYFSLDGKTYLSPAYSTSYDTTYTLEQQGGGWVVSNVEAQALNAVH